MNQLTSAPLVSVIMTSYKDPIIRVRRAIDSILNQTLQEFELIIVLEPGDANAEEILQLYQDPRLIIRKNSERLGLAASLNVCLENARGRYIARMDSDDYAYPDRLQKQVEFLRNNAEVSVVGAAGRLVDQNGTGVGIRRLPLDHETFVRKLAFTVPILHPTVTWDREHVGYDLRYGMKGLVYEDGELWLRLVGQGHRFANLQEVLIDYTQPPAGYTRNQHNWRCNLIARLRNWRTIIVRPRMLLGVFCIAILANMPQKVINLITKRSRFSDRMRAIVPDH